MSYRYISNQNADLSQTRVKADLIRRGYVPLEPESRDHIYDLLVERSHERFAKPVFETIQVKTLSRNSFRTHTRSSENERVSIHGKKRNSTAYADFMIDWIAAVDSNTGEIYYYHYDVYSCYNRIDVRKVRMDRDFGNRVVPPHWGKR